MGLKLIGTIGRLDPLKGHETLIRAMPYVLEKEPLTQLRIGGHDAYGYGRHLDELITSMDLTGVVTLEGFVDDVSTFLSRLDVFALASTDEGFGQAVVEAMAAGIPVVVSNIPAFREVSPGFFAIPNNPRSFARRIVFLLSKPDYAQAFGALCQKRALEMFSANVMVAKTIEVYNSLLSTRHGTRKSDLPVTQISPPDVETASWLD